jgi:hypothetical protein
MFPANSFCSENSVENYNIGAIMSVGDSARRLSGQKIYRSFVAF